MRPDPKLKVSFVCLKKFLFLTNDFTSSGTSLNQELYYKISCQKDEGYCLSVANCTVSTSEDQKDSYTIIDGQGCTNEPSLFEHVEVIF